MTLLLPVSKIILLLAEMLFVRAKFNSRIQKEGESADSFITSLYGLAEHCGFGTLHDELIRDRCRNSKL